MVTFLLTKFPNPIIPSDRRGLGLVFVPVFQTVSQLSKVIIKNTYDLLKFFLKFDYSKRPDVYGMGLSAI